MEVTQMTKYTKRPNLILGTQMNSAKTKLL